MSFVRIACLTLALGALGASVASAQGMPETPQQQKDRQFQLVFQEGLYALTRRDMPRAYQLFNQAVKLFPERPTAYYNLACAYSIDEKPEQAVKFLRLAYERGFNDLAHMSRDMDLDSIRKTPEYRQVRSEFEAAALADVPPPLSKLPEGAQGKYPLYVVIHSDRDVPQQILERTVGAVQRIEPGAVLVPQGPFALAGGARAWRSQTDQGAGRLEFLTMHFVREFLAKNPSVDPQRIYLIGLGFSGYKAVSTAGHHPDVFAGVYAHGPVLGAEVSELSVKTRAYLVVDPGDAGQVQSAVEARNRVFEQGGAAVLERWSGQPQNAIASGDAPFARGIAWLLGRDVDLPQRGESVPF